MRLKRISNEVAIADDKIVEIANADLGALTKSMASSALGRSRICAHKDSSDTLHEMIIALEQGSYIRPHKHPNKSESFHIIQGEVDIVIFDDNGNVRHVVQMGEFRSSRVFFYRLADPFFHTLIIRSDPVIFHETTNGPFRKEDTIFATWAPEEGNRQAVDQFMSSLAGTVSPFVSPRNPQHSLS